MSELFIHHDAKQDLLTLLRELSTKEVAARIAVLLEQLARDDDLLDRLTQHGFGRQGIDPFNISQWFEQQRQGNNLWRLKDWKFLQYRIIYAFIPTKHHYHILGIVPREFNYEASHALTQRILRAYEEL